MDVKLITFELRHLSDLLSLPLALYEGDRCLAAFAPHPVSFDMLAPWRPMLSPLADNPAFLLTEDALLIGQVRDTASRHVVYAGPVSPEKLHEAAMERILSAGSPWLLPSDLREITLYLNACQTISVDRFARLLQLLYGLISGAALESPPPPKDSAPVTGVHSLSALPPLESDFNLQYEDRILFYVQHGQTEKLRSMRSYDAALPTMAGSQLRQYKNALIILNSHCERAAIAGGLEKELSYRIGTSYIQQIESCRTVGDLVRLNLNMRIPVHYSEQVAQITDCRSSNPYIRRSIQYIRRNYQKKITVTELASHVHLSKEYLSSLFRREAGMTIPAYIAHQKILAAKEMLSFTDMSIIDISSFLSFSSQSYFQSVFKRITGETPLDYREKTNRGNISPDE